MQLVAKDKPLIQRAIQQLKRIKEGKHFFEPMAEEAVSMMLYNCKYFGLDRTEANLAEMAHIILGVANQGLIRLTKNNERIAAFCLYKHGIKGLYIEGTTEVAELAEFQAHDLTSGDVSAIQLSIMKQIKLVPGEVWQGDTILKALQTEKDNLHTEVIAARIICQRYMASPSDLNNNFSSKRDFVDSELFKSVITILVSLAISEKPKVSLSLRDIDSLHLILGRDLIKVISETIERSPDRDYLAEVFGLFGEDFHRSIQEIEQAVLSGDSASYLTACMEHLNISTEQTVAAFGEQAEKGANDLISKLSRDELVDLFLQTQEIDLLDNPDLPRIKLDEPVFKLAIAKRICAEINEIDPEQSSFVLSNIPCEFWHGRINWASLDPEKACEIMKHCDDRAGVELALDIFQYADIRGNKDWWKSWKISCLVDYLEKLPPDKAEIAENLFNSILET